MFVASIAGVDEAVSKVAAGVASIAGLTFFAFLATTGFTSANVSVFVASIAGVDEAVSPLVEGAVSMEETELLTGFAGAASAEGLALRAFLVVVTSAGGVSVNEP